MKVDMSLYNLHLRQCCHLDWSRGDMVTFSTSWWKVLWPHPGIALVCPASRPQWSRDIASCLKGSSYLGRPCNTSPLSPLETHSATWSKHNAWWVSRHCVKETIGSEITLAVFINSGYPSNWPGRDKSFKWITFESIFSMRTRFIKHLILPLFSVNLSSGCWEKSIYISWQLFGAANYIQLN